MTCLYMTKLNDFNEYFCYLLHFILECAMNTLFVTRGIAILARETQAWGGFKVMDHQI